MLTDFSCYSWVGVCVCFSAEGDYFVSNEIGHPSSHSVGSDGPRLLMPLIISTARISSAVYSFLVKTLPFPRSQILNRKLTKQYRIGRFVDASRFYDKPEHFEWADRTKVLNGTDGTRACDLTTVIFLRVVGWRQVSLARPQSQTYLLHPFLFTGCNCFNKPRTIPVGSIMYWAPKRFQLVHCLACPTDLSLENIKTLAAYWPSLTIGLANIPLFIEIHA